MKSLKILTATLVLAVLAAGCSEYLIPSYKYKLMFEVNTPDGVKSAYNVVEISHGVAFMLEAATVAHARGEALYLDLGPGRKPLVALVENQKDGTTYNGNWGEVAPFEILARVYGESFKSYGEKNENIGKLARHRGTKEIQPGKDLPMLVKFDDPNDPKSVKLVDPLNLEAALGQGVSWKRVTLEITDELITTGIENKLPWLQQYYDKLLDGHKPGSQGDGTLASHMNTTMFRQRG